jgi:hypothetical protein
MFKRYTYVPEISEVLADVITADQIEMIPYYSEEQLKENHESSGCGDQCEKTHEKMISVLKEDNKYGAKRKPHHREKFFAKEGDYFVKYKWGGVRIFPKQEFEEGYMECTQEAHPMFDWSKEVVLYQPQHSEFPDRTEFYSGYIGRLE